MRFKAKRFVYSLKSLRKENNVFLRLLSIYPQTMNSIYDEDDKFFFQEDFLDKTQKRNTTYEFKLFTL